MSDAIEWAGRVGAEWAKQADGLDGLLGPMGAVGLKTLGDVAGKRVLDLGCGAGATTLALAGAGAEAHGVDISQDLIARAKGRAADTNSSAHFHLADATDVQFETPFEALFSRFGAMFFADPVTAYRNLRAQMKPDVRAVIVAWTDPPANLWAALPMQIGREVLGIEPMPPTTGATPGPFTWAKQETFVPMLKEAGWRDISVDTFERGVVMSAGESGDPVERAVEFCLRIGPLAGRLRDIPKADQAELPAKLTAALTPFLDGDSVKVPGKAWLITMMS